MHTIHILKFIVSLESHLQMKHLGTNHMFAIFNSHSPQDRIACSLWFDWCTWSTLAILLSPALCRFVNDLATVFTNHSKSSRPNLAKNKQFRRIWAHTTESSLMASWSSGRIKWSSSQSVATCWGEETFSATLHYFSTHFSLLPVMSPKAFFSKEVVLLFEIVSSVSPVVANFLNNSVSDWAAWRSTFAFLLRAFPKHLICHWRWIWQIDFVLQSVPHGFHGLFFQHFLVHVDTQSLFSARQDLAMSVLFRTHFSNFSFLKNVGWWVTMNNPC